VRIATLAALCSASVFGADLPSLPLEVEIAGTEAPPGAIAQVRISLTHPHAIARAALAIEFDPAVFEPPVSADGWSAFGDQSGVAEITGSRVAVYIASEAGGIGRLSGTPFLVVNVRVKATARPGTSASIRTFAVEGVGGDSWRDIQGYRYRPAFPSFLYRVGGEISISGVTPGGGLLPRGTTIRIAGTGFAPQATLEVEGAPLANVKWVSAQSMEATLGAAADPTWRRVVVRNPDGASASFFPSLARKPASRQTGVDVTNILPIFPQQTFLNAADLGSTNGGSAYVFALQNPALQSVEVEIQLTGRISSRASVTLQPGEAYIQLPYRTIGVNTFSASAKAPIRMTPPGAGITRAEVAWRPQPDCYTFFSFNPTAIPCWLAASGAAPLSARGSIRSNAGASFRVNIDTEGGDWLTVTRGSDADPDFTLTADPKLPPGDYRATVTFTPDHPNLLPVSLPFLLRVTAAAVSLEDAPPFLWFEVNESPYSRGPARVAVRSNGEATPFTVRIEQQGAPDWLTVRPMQGVTPAELEVYVNPERNINGRLGRFIVSGPSNDIEKAVFMMLKDPPPRVMSVNPSSLTFWAREGEPAPGPHLVSTSATLDSVAVSTESGGDWLSAVRHTSGVAVAVDSGRRRPGTYRGTVTLTADAVSNQLPGSVPVTLTVWSEPPAVSALPASLTLTAQSRSFSEPIQVAVASGDVATTWKATVSTTDGNPWLLLAAQASSRPEEPLSVQADARDLPPGTYSGSLLVEAPSGSARRIAVPVSLTVVPAGPANVPPGVPLVGSIVNAASNVAGAVSPGEAVTIFGSNLGADESQSFKPDPPRVHFDGVPAPLLFASPTQLNAVAPYEIRGREQVTVAIQFNGTRSETGVAVTSAAPGLFTADNTGRGQARASNADGSGNGFSDPANRGSTIRFQATGLGDTVPPGITGERPGNRPRVPVLPVSMTIGGLEAVVQDVTPDPDQVSGVFAVTAIVPAGVTPGRSVPVVLKVGSHRSPDGVTIAVR
jgi:uncharacterized protein (TIGR03437 family)